MVDGQTKKWISLYAVWGTIDVMNEAGQLRETFTRGVGLAADIGTLIAVTHHAGSWTNGTFYIHNNHRGDIVLTRSGTTTVSNYDYSAFGNPQSAIGPDLCRFKFSSKERDPSNGFYYSGYRYYAPAWQRWVSRDPIAEVGGINLHVFVENNPLNKVDPADEWAAILRVLLARYLPMCKNLRCKVEIHHAHHPFPVIGKKCHLRVTCWIKGQKGPGVNLRIPLPEFLCPGKKPLSPHHCAGQAARVVFW
ncbi:MAG: RHS repeat-associated core domain-containing protein [Verrucomicrobiae bacterium]|nr:RHS repeat-associated core domain-containing protein [Verrucomicrobiae bacterium]